jgi:hypothetical protein
MSAKTPKKFEIGERRFLVLKKDEVKIFELMFENFHFILSNNVLDHVLSILHKTTLQKALQFDFCSFIDLTSWL